MSQTKKEKRISLMRKIHTRTARKPGLRTKIALPLFAVFTLILLTGLPAQAQTVSGSLSGTVVDGQGAVVPGANISVKNTATGNLRQVKTNHSGAYIVPALPAAAYQVEAEAPGFGKSVSNVSLAIGQDLVLDVSLTVAATEAQVMVESGSGVLQQESAELSGVIGRKQILDLPLNGRSYSQLALLEPGVVATTNRRGGVARHGMQVNINGAGARSNGVLLDGTSTVDAYNSGVGNAVGNSLGVDAVQEFRVLTNAYSAQYGGSSGGMISIITKSGTNDFHGTAFEFLRNDNLDARNFFDDEKPEFKRNQFGVAVGGPIIRDRTFFFGTGEWLRERLGRTIVSTVPSLSARQGTVNPAVVPYLNAFFPLPNGRNFGGGLAEYIFPFSQNTDETFFQGRIDHKLSENNTLFGRYTFNDAAGILPTDFPIMSEVFSSRHQFLTLEDTHIINPTLVNTARFSFSRTYLAEGAQLESSVASNLSFLPGRRVGALFIGGMPNFGGLSNGKIPSNVFAMSDDMSWAKGSHSLQWGTLISRQQLNLYSDRFSPGQYTFSSVQQFLAGNSSRLQIALRPDGAIRYMRNTMFGAYLQDSFKVKRNLTLNLGLRYEFSTVPKEKFGRTASIADPLHDTKMIVGPLFKNDKQNWAPRIGVAWNPWADGKTVVRAGFGIFYDINPIPFFISGGAITVNPPFDDTVTLVNPSFPNPNLAGVIQAGLLSINPAAYDWRTSHMFQYNLAVERELWADTVWSVAYAGSRGKNIIRSGDINLAIPQILPNGQPFFAANLPRRNPSFSAIDWKRNDGDSWYNALQTKARSRLGSNLQLQASYTFSRSIDTTSGLVNTDAVGSIPQVLDPDRPNMDRGLSDFHRKHNLVANFTWELPFARARDGIAGVALGGWAMSGIFTAQSGNPFTVGIQSNWSQSQNRRVGIDRPNVAPGCNAENIILGEPDKYYNPACFVLPLRGTYGNLGRNVLIGPGVTTVDLSLTKSFRLGFLGEGGKLQLQADCFNILNHANFDMPARIVFAGVGPTESPVSTAGRITSTTTSSRQVQLGLRLSW
jgi:hypothetical protein